MNRNEEKFRRKSKRAVFSKFSNPKKNSTHSTLLEKVFQTQLTTRYTHIIKKRAHDGGEYRSHE
jgi:hypothetical protein